MSKFKPNEAIVADFQRIVSGAGAKVKKYLLNRVGLTTHDIRIALQKPQPLSLLDTSAAGFEFAALRHFSRVAENARICILNASNSNPVITELHFFVEIPASVPITITSTFDGNEIRDPSSGKVLSVSRSFLSPPDETLEYFEIPVLKKGAIIAVNAGTFKCGLEMNIDPEVKESLYNEPDFSPSKDWLNKTESAYRKILCESAVWYGLVLDNEDLLPFKWNYDQQRFVPGFFSSELDVSGG